VNGACWSILKLQFLPFITRSDRHQRCDGQFSAPTFRATGTVLAGETARADCSLRTMHASITVSCRCEFKRLGCRIPDAYALYGETFAHAVSRNTIGTIWTRWSHAMGLKLQGIAPSGSGRCSHACGICGAMLAQGNWRSETIRSAGGQPSLAVPNCRRRSMPHVIDDLPEAAGAYAFLRRRWSTLAVTQANE
jgi:hypothetical protein